MNIANILLRTATTFADTPALFVGDTQVYTYRDWASRAGKVAAALVEKAGLVPGDRVAFFMGNSTEYLEILYGVWIAGCAVVPINAKLHSKEVTYILNDSGARVLFVDEERIEDFADSSSSVPNLGKVIVPGGQDYEAFIDVFPMTGAVFRDPDDLAWLFYTSGTTGRPKGVIETHGILLTMVMGYFTDVEAPSREDAVIYAAPMSHASGMSNFVHVLAGDRHVIPASGGFDPAEIVELSKSFGRLTLFAAPTMVKRLAQHIEQTGADPSGFRTIIYGGGPMYVEDLRHAIGVMGNCFVQLYGQGEAPMSISVLSRYHLSDTSHPRYLARIGSVGLPMSMNEIRIADGDGNSLPAGEIGEILVRGHSIMPGYWDNPKATAETIRDGWLWTGDVGSMDEDGFLTLTDRSKDMIVSGGSNIYPREVEEVLLTHPAVKEVSVVGKKDDDWGESVVAFVVFEKGKEVPFDELDKLCLDHIARFKRPKTYRSVEGELPKSSYGKVLKTELRILLE